MIIDSPYDCQMWNLEIGWLSVWRLFLLHLTFIFVEYLKAFQSFYSMFVLIIENPLWMLNIWSHRRLLHISIAFISVGCLMSAEDSKPFYATFAWTLMSAEDSKSLKFVSLKSFSIASHILLLDSTIKELHPLWWYNNHWQFLMICNYQNWKVEVIRQMSNRYLFSLHPASFLLDVSRWSNHFTLHFCKSLTVSYGIGSHRYCQREVFSTALSIHAFDVIHPLMSVFNS